MTDIADSIGFWQERISMEKQLKIHAVFFWQGTVAIWQILD